MQGKSRSNELWQMSTIVSLREHTSSTWCIGSGIRSFTSSHFQWDKRGARLPGLQFTFQPLGQLVQLTLEGASMPLLSWAILGCL